MTAKGTPSAQDGFKSYCRDYDRNQRDLQERAMAKKPDDVVTVPNGPGLRMTREAAEQAGLAYVAEPARDGLSDYDPVKPREMLPCPFCGAPGMVTKTTTTDWYGHWMAACSADDDSCPADPYLYRSDKPEGRAQAIAAWNTRAPAAPTEAMVKRAARAIHAVEFDAGDAETGGKLADDPALHKFRRDQARAALTAAQGEKEGE